MAGTTTYYGISYPTSTDYVKDGATAMQTIADGFDSAVAIPTYNNQTGTTYTFVLADAGKTVTSNNASAVTFTIPPQASVAWANNTTLTVRNLGAGVVTIAGGAGVTVTNTAQTVAQYGSVRIIRTASNAWTVVPASGASGLTFITSATFTTQSAVNVSNVFSSTYANYRVELNISAFSTAAYVTFRFRNSGGDVTAANYGYAARNFSSAGTGSDVSVNNRTQTLGYLTGVDVNDATHLSFDIYAPNLAIKTALSGTGSGNLGNFYGFGVGYNTTDVLTGFSIIPNNGTITGTVRTYGYEN